jgi:hypothetical protein
MTYYNFNITLANNTDESILVSIAANSCASALDKAYKYANEQNKGKASISYVNFHIA